MLEDLLELGQRSLVARAPFFARLLNHRRTPDPAVRAAVIRALAGAQGYEAVRAIALALDDEAAEVREAGVDALVATSFRSPARLVHALFHPNPSVRRRALETARHPPPMAVQLLADPLLIDVAEQRSNEILSEGRAVLAVLDMLKVGIIDDDRARAVLRRAPWVDRLAPIVDALPNTYVHQRAVDDVARFEQALRIPDREDRFDDVVRLLADDDDFLDALVDAVQSRVLDGERGIRVAWSLVRTINMLGRTDVRMAAVASVWIPIMLGWEPLPIAVRKAAAAKLPELQPIPLFSHPLTALFDAEICRLEHGGLDLSVVVGVLKLSNQTGIRNIARHGEMKDWVDAFRNAPAIGVELLSAPPTANDVELYRSIVAALLTDPKRDLDLAIDLVLAVANVRAELYPLVEVAKQDRTLAPAMLLRAKERDVDRSLTTKPNRRARFVKWIAAALDLAQIDALFLKMASDELAEGDWIDGEVLSAAVRERDPADIATRVIGFSNEVQLGLLRWIGHAGHFPSGAFYAIVGRLSASADSDIRALATRMAEPVVVPDRSAVTAGTIRPLTDEEREQIRTCDDDDLAEVLEVVFAEPVSGLASALLARSSPATSVVACCATLFAYDEEEGACRTFDRYAGDAEWLPALESEMVARGRNAEPVPLLAAAWLFRWDKPFGCFVGWVAGEGDLRRTLQDSLTWPSPLVVEQVWRAVGRLAVQLRMREPARFAEDFDLEVGKIVASAVHTLGVVAAKILVEMHIGGVEAATMDQLQEIVVDNLDRTDDATRAELQRWFDVSGAPETVTVTTFDEDLEDEAATSTDVERLAELAAMDDPSLARAAASRLTDIGGPEVVTVLLERARGRVAFGRLWAELLGPMLDDEQRRLLLVDEGVSPALRFALALEGLEAGETERWDDVVRAVCTDDEERWFGSADYERIEAAGVDAKLVAVDLSASNQHAAYTRAVRALVAMPFDDDVQAALIRFLDAGTSRIAALRLSAARCLLEKRHPYGLAIVFSAALERWQRNDGNSGPPFLRFVPWLAEEVAVCAMAAGITNGNGLMEELGQLARTDRPHKEAALLAVLHSADTKTTQEAALRSLPRTHTSAVKLRQLAEIFAWGARESRLLLGSAYRVHLIGGAAYGHTRLEHRSIYVNPLAFIRGVRGGEDVLRGLIVHELGHHVFHAGEAGLAIWKEAEREKKHGLLNLVADEHLERNLRAKREAHGNHLKGLAAHAFQHADKAIVVRDLVRMLGPQTYDILVHTRLSVARSSDKVEVALGKVFQELERTGSSFVRFVRALRMGLGDRHDDQKVRLALSLFKGAQFRSSDMPKLWEITKKVAEIFQQESELIELMDLHSNTAEDGVDGTIELPGVDDEAVQREVDRILDGGDKRGPPMRTINRSENEAFKEITNIERIDPVPAAHRTGVNRVARAARRLREILQHLGLQLEPRRARLRGRSIDRVGLSKALLRRDPRMLIAREVVTKSDLYLGVVIDCSGSMGLDQNLEKAKLFGLLLAEACKNLRGVDARFWGFTDTKIFDAGTAERCAVSGLYVAGGNNDAAALWHAAQEAKRSRRRAKVLVMISDGAPTECSVAALRALVKKLETKMGFVCAQVAVRELDDHCFSHHIDLIDDDLDRAVRRFGQVVSRLVRAALSAA